VKVTDNDPRDNNLFKLQEQIGDAFIHWNHEGEFDEIRTTVPLLTALYGKFPGNMRDIQ